MIDKPSILVVEDEEFIREIICETLMDADFIAIGAPNAAAAMRLLNGPTRIDAAFLDIDLGDRAGGFLVARHARATHPGIPIIYTSGGAQPGFSVERVDDSLFVPKPYRPSRICTLLTEALRH